MIKNFLEKLTTHCAWRLFRWGAIILWALAAVGQAVILLLVKPDCASYDGPLYESLFMTFVVVSYAMLGTGLIETIACLAFRRFRRALVLFLLTAAAISLSLWIFAEGAMYCLGEAIVRALGVAFTPLFQTLTQMLEQKQ